MLDSLPCPTDSGDFMSKRPSVNLSGTESPHSRMYLTHPRQWVDEFPEVTEFGGLHDDVVMNEDGTWPRRATQGLPTDGFEDIFNPVVCDGDVGCMVLCFDGIVDEICKAIVLDGEIFLAIFASDLLVTLQHHTHLVFNSHPVQGL